MIKKESTILALGAILMLGIVAPSLPVATAAEALICAGTYTQGEFEKVDVPAGATCNLYSSDGQITIQGDIDVGEGGTLHMWAYGHSFTINGNIKADDADKVTINGVTVNGNVSVKQGEGGITISSSTVSGNVQLDQNSDHYAVVNNSISGNLQIDRNTSSYDSPLYNNVAGNQIGGNLDCKNNEPAPVNHTFGPNTVDGQKKDQCASF